MNELKDINKNGLTLSAENIIVPALNKSLAQAIKDRDIQVPSAVEEEIDEIKATHAFIKDVVVNVTEGETASGTATFSEGVLTLNLVTVKGADGVQGKSAYEIAVANGYEGTEGEWIESLKGSGLGANSIDTTDLSNSNEKVPSSKLMKDKLANVGTPTDDQVVSAINKAIESGKLSSSNVFTDTFVESLKELVRNSEAYPDSLYITDGIGNVIFQIKDGTINFAGDSRCFLGKNLFSVGDSLCASGEWQDKLATLLCANFDQTLNIDKNRPISYGGSATRGTDQSIGQVRCKNLVSLKDEQNIDLVIIENINDYNHLYALGTSADSPFMVGNILTGHETFDSQEEAETWLKANFATALSSVTSDKRIGNSILLFPYKTSGTNAKKVSITSKATASGTAYLNVAGKSYGIDVTPEMSINDIVSALENYNYGGGWQDINNGDGSITIIPYGGTTTTCSFDANGTGINATITDTNAVEQLAMYFLGLTSSEWEDTSKWTDSQPSLWSYYKGMFEYLQTNLPNACLYFMVPTRYSISLDGDATFLKSDGSFDIDLYRETADFTRYKQLTDFQKSVCELYDIKVLDVEKNCGINLFNIETFYSSNNVHPKTAGYNRWAETIYNLIK